MKTVFNKQASCYNPLFVNGKEIYKFYIFTTSTIENKKIIGSFRWLSVGGHGSNNDLDYFSLDCELKNKRSFDRDCKLFMLKEIHNGEKVNVVYINSLLLNINKSEYTPLNYNTHSTKRYKYILNNLDFKLHEDRQKFSELGIGFINSGEETQTEKQKAYKKIQDLFRDKFGNNVPSYYLSDLAKFFKKNSRLANKAEIK
jgi:hypothetical protein